MKEKLIFIILGMLISFDIFGQVNPPTKSVRSYTKKDGTYVPTHKRTVENGTNRDNYTTKPNTNPYNGKKGYIEPDRKPATRTRRR